MKSGCVATGQCGADGRDLAIPSKAFTRLIGMENDEVDVGACEDEEEAEELDEEAAE